MWDFHFISIQLKAFGVGLLFGINYTNELNIDLVAQLISILSNFISKTSLFYAYWVHELI